MVIDWNESSLADNVLAYCIGDFSKLKMSSTRCQLSLEDTDGLLMEDDGSEGARYHAFQQVLTNINEKLSRAARHKNTRLVEYASYLVEQDLESAYEFFTNVVSLENGDEEGSNLSFSTTPDGFRYGAVPGAHAIDEVSF